MLKFRILLVLFVFNGAFAVSGATVIDSLQAALRKNLPPNHRVDALNDLAWEYLEIEPSEGLVLAQEALLIAEKQTYYAGMAYALGNMAVLHEVMGHYPQAMEFYMESLKLYQKMKDSAMSNTIRHNIALLLGQVGDYENALSYYQQTLTYDSLHHRKTDLLVDYLNIGATYRELGLFKMAQYYYHKGLFCSKRQKFTGVHFFNNLANLYLQKGVLDSAGHYITRARLKAGSENQNLRDTYNLLAFGEYLLAVDSLDSAKVCIEKGLTKARSKKYADGIMKGLSIRSQWYQAVGDDSKALLNFQRYSHFRDSLLNIRRKARVDIIEQRLRINDNERVIRGLETERALELNRTKTLIIGFTLVVLVSVFTVALLWQIRMKNLKLSERNAVIEEQLVEIKALAKESHHRIKNNLQVVSSLLKLQSNNVQNAAAKSALSEAYGRVRTIALIHQKLYKEDNFSKVDLKEFMEQLLSNISTSMGNEHMINIQRYIPSIWIKVDAAIFIGLIVNELVTNSFKYAFSEDQQGEVTVRIERVGTKLQIKVSDDGVGYPLELLSDQESSFGLSIVKSLLRIFKGVLEIKNQGGAESRVLLNEVEILKEE